MGMTHAAAVLRLEVEEAVLAEVVRAGAAFQRSAVVSRFLGRGAGKSTLFRWVQEFIESGAPGQHVSRLITLAAAERVAHSEHPGTDLAAAVSAKLPIRVSRAEMAGAVHVVDKLCEIIADYDLLIRHARTDDGKVRNGRLLVVANAELRRCLETAVKLYQAMRDIDQVDRMRDAILEEIAKLSPETAEAIYRRIAHCGRSAGPVDFSKDGVSRRLRR
jgi:hypothetical protein